MSGQNVMVNTVESDGKWLYRVGGISALVFGLGYIAIIGFYVPMGAPPSGVEARLSYVAGNLTLWRAILGLSVLTDFLLLPVMVSLYNALKEANKNAMLLATACVGLFVLLDLALTWTNYAVLIDLGRGYAAATSEMQRATFVAAAHYPAAVLESNLLFVYNTLTLSVGLLIAGLVMFQGNFGKVTATLGLATGILGIIAVAASFFTSVLDFTIILASALTTIWAFFTGFTLYRLNKN